MKNPPIVQKGNLNLPADFTKHECYIVGYDNSILEVTADNSAVAIRSVKYSTHKIDDPLGYDKIPNDETRITILLRGGPWRQTMWREQNKSDAQEFTLTDEGDYLVWEPGFYHNWAQLGNSTMLTISLFQSKLRLNNREKKPNKPEMATPRKPSD